MHRFHLTLILLSSSALVAPAEARFSRGGSPSAVSGGACPYGSGLGDGCTATQGIFKDQNFLANARTSGQTWAAGTHPQTYNVAYVDYGVGNYTPTASLNDPATQYSTNCTMPSDGVTYCATGNQWGGPRLLVSPTNSDITLAHMNFSDTALTGFGHGCVAIMVSQTATRKIYYDDNYFENNVACLGNVPTNGGVAGWGMVYSQNSTNSVIGGFIATNSAWIGHAKVTDCCALSGSLTVSPLVDVPGLLVSAITLSSKTAGAEMRIEHSIIKEWPSHFYGWQGWWNGSSCDNMTALNMGYNVWIDAFHTDPSQGHGETGNMSCGSFHSYYETYWSSGTAYGQSSTSMVSVDQVATNMTTIEIDHATSIANRMAGATINSESLNYSIIAGVAGTTRAKIQVTSTPSGPLLGAGLSGQTAFLTQNFSGSGLNSQWLYSCGASAASNACPNITSSRGVGNEGAATANSGTATFVYYPQNANFGFGHALSTGATSIHDNFMDYTGSNGVPFIASGGATCATPTVFSNNMNLVTGSTSEAQMIGWNGSGGPGC